MPKPTIHHAYVSGKGSYRRPCLVPRKMFENNWDEIFGTKASSPFFCEHANESPAECSCPWDCYCRMKGNCPCLLSNYLKGKL